jgi:hypothetical protein
MAEFEAAVLTMQERLDDAHRQIDACAKNLPDDLKLLFPWKIVTITTLAYMNQSIDMDRVRALRNNPQANRVIREVFDEFSIQIEDAEDATAVGAKRKKYFKNTAIINYNLSDEENKKSIKIFNNKKQDVGKLHLTGTRKVGSNEERTLRKEISGTYLLAAP